MPYIDPKKRKKFDSAIDRLVGNLEPDCPLGELNYCLSRIVWKLWKTDPCYAAGNGLIGALECVKQEFYRRMLAPYEDGKRIQEGDIV